MESKMRSADRILMLEPIDGKNAKTNAGLVDTSLFTGGNKLHAKMDTESTLWSFQYDKGVLPEPLRENKFTNFKKAKEFAKNYFLKRNIQITEVKD